MPEDYQNALPQGAEIDSYRIERTLGVGGFGITYLVSDLNLGQQYAIKELLPDGIAVRQSGKTIVVPRSAGSEDDFAATKKYFISEAQILAGMNHPAVVKVQRLMEANGTCYMLMDYVKGETLSEHLKKRGGTLSGAGEFLQIFYPLMEGLDALHSQGFIHRDIKPANIMVKPDGSPVLLDFGAATQTQSQTMTITQMLSAGYSPFEQYTSRAKQGPYTDIYALGATMYKAITGKKPDDASDRVYNDPYQSLLWYEDYISIYGRPILSAVDAALKMEPKQRPQSVQAWLRMLDGGKEETTPEKVPEKVPVSMPSQDWPQEEWEVEGSSWAKPKIKKEVWVGGLIAALILGAFIVIMTSVLRDEPVVEQVEEVEEVSALTEVPWEIEVNTEASEAEDMPEIPEIPEVAEALYTGTPEEEVVEGDPGMAALEAAQALFKEGQRFPSGFFDRVDKDALKSLAESGNAEAQFLWGRAHDSSLGLLGNDGEAARWYLKAAEAGDARGQYMLAVMYAKGKGVAKNSNEAVKWGRRAAEQGHPWAQYYLGRYYLYGIGVPQDRAIAKLWLNKAYENNDAKAKKAATDLWAKVLSAERGSGIQILRATYGAENTHKDVTAIVRKKVDNGRLSFDAHSGELGGDPIFGKVKTFTITYLRGGQQYTKKYREGSQVNLP